MIALDAGAALLLVLLLLIVGALIGVAAAGEIIERVVVVRGGDDFGVLEEKSDREVAAGRARSPRARDLLHRQAARRPPDMGANG